MDAESGSFIPVPGLVGRGDEQTRVDRFMQRLDSGPSALMIRGEQGMGKTALWRAAIESARESGLQVLTARCAPEEMPIPLVGLTDLLVDEPHEGLLTDDIDPAERGRRLLSLVREMGEDGPVVLAIDDVQWLDLGTVRTLRYLLRRLDRETIGLLATCLVESEAGDPLETARMFPGGGYDQIGLGPLDAYAIRRVLASVRSAVSRPTLDRITELSGGNPHYALELARSMSDAPLGLLEAVPLPDSLHTAIDSVLEGIPEELMSLLEMMATTGPVGIELMEKMLPDLDVPGLVEWGRNDGVVVVEDDLKIRFEHPLVGSALYERISPLKRRSLHRIVATNANTTEMVARHLAISVLEPDEGVAATLEQAAEAAARKGAFELAAEFACHSLRLTPAGYEDAAGRRALAEAMHRAAAGETGRAIALLDGMIADLPDSSQRATAVSQRFYLDVEGAYPLLQEALDGASHDPYLRCRVLELLGWRHTFWGDLASAERYLNDAIEIAVSNGFRQLEMEGLASLAMVHEQRGEPRPERLTRAIELAEESDEKQLIRPPRTLEGRRLLWAGEVDQARDVFEEMRDEVADAGIKFQRPFRIYDLAMVEIMAGNFRLAADLITDGLIAAADGGNPEAEAWLIYAGSLVDAWVGDTDDARRAAEWRKEWALARGEIPGVARSLCVLGLVDLSVGEFNQAADNLLEAAEALEERGIGHPGTYPALPDGIEALVRAGRLEEAEVLLDRLVDRAGRLDQAWTTAAMYRAEGLVEMARGAIDDAVANLMKSADLFHDVGCRPDAARSVYLTGCALRRGGERNRAAQHLEDAREGFESMGAVEWVRRATEELERVSPGSSSMGLTTTESRIATLVADGMKNREIAAALFVSVATVEAHLTRIYRKLAIRGRSELARLVAEEAVTAGDPLEA